MISEKGEKDEEKEEQKTTQSKEGLQEKGASATYCGRSGGYLACRRRPALLLVG